MTRDLLCLPFSLSIFIHQLSLLESMPVFDMGTTPCNASNDARQTLDWSLTDATTGMVELEPHQMHRRR